MFRVKIDLLYKLECGRNKFYVLLFTYGIVRTVQFSIRWLYTFGLPLIQVVPEVIYSDNAPMFFHSTSVTLTVSHWNR